MDHLLAFGQRIAGMSAESIPSLQQGQEGYYRVTGEKGDTELTIASQQEALNLNGRLHFESKTRPACKGLLSPVILDFGRCVRATGQHRHHQTD